jgi:4-oxalocrotonate tautomerase
MENQLAEMQYECAAIILFRLPPFPVKRHTSREVSLLIPCPFLFIASKNDFRKNSSRGSPSMAKGVGLRLLSRRGSWVQIPPPALEILNISLGEALSSRNVFLPYEAIYVPVVELTVWSGITLENKKKVVEGITRVLEEVGIPRDAITIIMREEPKENWATGGELHSERFAGFRPQS